MTSKDSRDHSRALFFFLRPKRSFLTKNAPGLRTSPVKRGYWAVKQVLGEHIPPPPAVVPELPRDEAKLDLPDDPNNNSGSLPVAQPLGRSFRALLSCHRLLLDYHDSVSSAYRQQW